MTVIAHPDRSLSERGPVRGTIALQGGGPFAANDELDRRLLGACGADRVVVLPTADAFEQPGKLIATSMEWAERLGVEVEALMVLQRRDAEDEGAAGVVRRRAPSTSSATPRCTCAASSRTRRC